MVHSTKHYVQITLSTATTGVRVNNILALGVAKQDANTGNEVEEGSTLKAVFFEMWVIGSVSDQFYTAIIEKKPAGAAPATFTEMTNLFTYDNKKNILYTTQGLASNDGIAMPVPIFKGWFKIPKGKQRFGLGDSLNFTIASRGSATITFCGFATYKEYS